MPACPRWDSWRKGKRESSKRQCRIWVDLLANGDLTECSRIVIDDQACEFVMCIRSCLFAWTEGN